LEVFQLRDWSLDNERLVFTHFLLEYWKCISSHPLSLFLHSSFFLPPISAQYWPYIPYFLPYSFHHTSLFYLCILICLNLVYFFIFLFYLFMQVLWHNYCWRNQGHANNSNKRTRTGDQEQEIKIKTKNRRPRTKQRVAMKQCLQLVV
jgi:hypothetical protein